MFTAAEYHDMLIVYGACGESAYAVVEAYAARFPANDQGREILLLGSVRESIMTPSETSSEKKYFIYL
jgi:hypothetical protein